MLPTQPDILGVLFHRPAEPEMHHRFRDLPLGRHLIEDVLVPGSHHASSEFSNNRLPISKATANNVRTSPSVFQKIAEIKNLNVSRISLTL